MLAEISRKYNPSQYSRIRALYDAEMQETDLFAQLAKKFSQDSSYVPTLRQRLRMFTCNVKYYYTRLRVIITIIAPIIILFWYFKYRHVIDSDKYWEEVRQK